MGPMVDVVPPTVFLPSLRGLAACARDEIRTALARLRMIYIPEVRGSSRRRGEAESQDTDAGELAALRADAFERAFAIQWLTRFVATRVSDDGEMLEEAAALLAICAGASASGTITRTFKFAFQPHPSASDAPKDISIILRDAPLESSDFSSVGAQTWGGSCILAEMMASSPRQFSITHANTAPLRALELGAGTGLASLVLAKVLTSIRGADDDLVLATDIYPAALANLRVNLAVNFPAPAQADSEDMTQVSSSSQQPPHSARPGPGPGPRMEVLPLDWSAVHTAQLTLMASVRGHRNEGGTPQSQGVVAADGPPIEISRHALSAQSQAEAHVTRLCPTGPGTAALLREPFDLIIGADIIYERAHAMWVRSCVERFMRRPGGMFHLVIPLRRGYGGEVGEVWRRVGAHVDAVDGDRLDLAIVSEEDIVCDAYSDRGDGEEVVYRYYRIGWVPCDA